MELAPLARQRFFDSNGDPLSGGKVYTYEAGTDTPKTTYTNRAGSATNTNPIILDADGECDIWLDTGYYKFELYDSANVLQWTKDNIALASTEALSSAFFRGVIPLTFASSPYTITSADNGKLISVDSTGGAVSIVMPQLSTIILPFNIAIKLETGTNAVTVTRAGTDVFGAAAATSKVMSAVGQSVQFIGSIAEAPDQWRLLDLGVTTSTPTRRSVSASTLVTTTDDEITVTAEATITLLAAATVGAKPVRIINAIAAGGTVTITRSGSDTIWGETSQYLYNQYDNLLFIPDGVSKYNIGG